jgi:hypothetical protein
MQLSDGAEHADNPCYDAASPVGVDAELRV